MNDFIINGSKKKKQTKNLFFHFYFLNKDISLNIRVRELRFGTYLNNIHMEGTVSPIFYLGLSFYFIPKNG